MFKQDSGVYACVAERKERYNLGEFKEELQEQLGLNTEEKGSLPEFLRRGYRVSPCKLLGLCNLSIMVTREPFLFAKPLEIFGIIIRQCRVRRPVDNAELDLVGR